MVAEQLIQQGFDPQYAADITSITNIIVEDDLSLTDKLTLITTEDYQMLDVEKIKSFVNQYMKEATTSSEPALMIAHTVLNMGEKKFLKTLPLEYRLGYKAKKGAIARQIAQLITKMRVESVSSLSDLASYQESLPASGDSRTSPKVGSDTSKATPDPGVKTKDLPYGNKFLRGIM